MRTRSAFTLIELMIVVAIIAIIAAIAIPSLLRSKITANETSAIATIKATITAEEQYKATSGSSVYGTPDQLGATVPPYFDLDQVRDARKSGYCFTLTVGIPADSNWYGRADPITPGKTGNRHFFADSTGIIRFRLGGPADSTDTPIQ